MNPFLCENLKVPKNTPKNNGTQHSKTHDVCVVPIIKGEEVVNGLAQPIHVKINRIQAIQLISLAYLGWVSRFKFPNESVPVMKVWKCIRIRPKPMEIPEIQLSEIFFWLYPGGNLHLLLFT